MDEIPARLEQLHPDFAGVPSTAGLLARLFDVRRSFGRLSTQVAVRLMPVRRVATVRIRRSEMGGVRVRAYTPAHERTDAVLFWVHGGGMVSGHPRMDDLICSELAAGLGMQAVGVAYRLAPRYPFPIPLDDLERAWDGLVARLRRAGCAPRVVIGGQSAGAGLAAAVVQRIHDRGGVQPVGQWLFCPMLDDRTAGDRTLDALDYPVWNNRLNRFGWESFLNAPAGAENVPAGAVPARRVDLRGLPPAWLGVGTVDLFHDAVLEYAQRLANAEVPATLDVVAGAPHAFESLVPAASRSQEYRTRALRWVSALVGTELDEAHLERFSPSRRTPWVRSLDSCEPGRRRFR